MIKRIFSNYLIDEYGNVYSLKRKIFLHQYMDKDGYSYVTIKAKHYKTHRLVAEAFIGNPGNKPCIDHIDRNRQNNFYQNLRWVTPKENSNNENTIKHLKEIGKRYKTQYGKQVIDNQGNSYISIIEASRRTGVPRSNIQYHLKNKTGEWLYA